MNKLEKFLLALAALGCLTAALVAPAGAGNKLRSTKLDSHLCQTTGGGAFVAIPDFPGEEIDRRLLTDIKWMEQRWDIFVTDAYSHDSVHAANGEHPIGLAADIVPNKATGGTWNKIDRLAAWAEPTQNRPRAPFSWVGYDGDAGHGRGDHLHLSWSHSDTKPFHPAATVYTVNCPKARVSGGDGGGGNGGGGNSNGGGGTGSGGTGSGNGDGGKGDGGGKGGNGGGTGGHGPGGHGHGSGDGGVDPGSGDSRSAGGVSARVAGSILRQQQSGSSVETGGVGLG